jgi:trigger factor
MHSQIEILEGLSRRLTLGLPVQDIEKEVEARLKQLARTVRMQGFRPGKVPMNLIARKHGDQVRQDVVSDALRQGFGETAEAQRLRIIGMPRFSPKKQGEGAETLEFDAYFEVYPEITIGDISNIVVERPLVQVGEEDVEHTLLIMRQQRVQYFATDRAAEKGDRVTLNYEGRLEGEVFPGGKADGFVLILGDGRVLPDFEKAITGMKVGEAKDFNVEFPKDYPVAELAGRTAQFHTNTLEVAAPRLPALDAEFAKTLGVDSGDVAKLREEVKANLEREVSSRKKTRMKETAFQKLIEMTPFEVPQTAVQMEAEQIAEQTAKELQARGISVGDYPMNHDAMMKQAERRVRMGLLLTEVVKTNSLKVSEETVRAKINEFAQSYENPSEVVAWYYGQAERRRDIESLVLEDLALEWVLSKARVEDKPLTMQELMGSKQ